MHRSLYERKKIIDRNLIGLIILLILSTGTSYVRFVQENEKVIKLTDQLASYSENCDVRFTR